MNDTYSIRAWAVAPDGSKVPIRCAYARTFAQRFFGLMGKRSVPVNCGLVFERCRSIHMMFMRVPLDVLWLAPKCDERYQVIGLSSSVKPWGGAAAPRGATVAMEFGAGTFSEKPAYILLDDGAEPAASRQRGVS